MTGSQEVTGSNPVSSTKIRKQIYFQSVYITGGYKEFKGNEWIKFSVIGLFKVIILTGEGYVQENPTAVCCNVDVSFMSGWRRLP